MDDTESSNYVENFDYRDTRATELGNSIKIEKTKRDYEQEQQDLLILLACCMACM